MSNSRYVKKATTPVPINASIAQRPARKMLQTISPDEKFVYSTAHFFHPSDTQPPHSTYIIEATKLCVNAAHAKYTSQATLDISSFKDQPGKIDQVHAWWRESAAKDAQRRVNNFEWCYESSNFTIPPKDPISGTIQLPPQPIHGKNVPIPVEDPSLTPTMTEYVKPQPSPQVSMPKMSAVSSSYVKKVAKVDATVQTDPEPPKVAEVDARYIKSLLSCIHFELSSTSLLCTIIKELFNDATTLKRVVEVEELIERMQQISETVASFAISHQTLLPHGKRFSKSDEMFPFELPVRK